MADSDTDIKVEALKDLLLARLCGLRQLLDERQEFNREALTLQAKEYERRLEALNNSHRVIAEFQAGAVAAPACELKMNQLEKEVKSLELTRSNLEGKSATTAAWVAVAVAIVISVAGSVIARMVP